MQKSRSRFHPLSPRAILDTCPHRIPSSYLSVKVMGSRWDPDWAGWKVSGARILRERRGVSAARTGTTITQNRVTLQHWDPCGILHPKILRKGTA